MRLQSITFAVCLTITGVISFLVSGYGFYMSVVEDFRLGTLAVGLFCVLPMLSFPAFLAGFWRRPLSVTLHWVFALGYLSAFSWLDWRTCSELGYCGNVMSTVIQTMTARPVAWTFAVAVANLAALVVRVRRQPAREGSRAVAISG